MPLEALHCGVQGEGLREVEFTVGLRVSDEWAFVCSPYYSEAETKGKAAAKFSRRYAALI